jgi:hypothetical protein
MKWQLKENLNIKDLDHLKYFVGIEIAYSQDELFLIC